MISSSPHRIARSYKLNTLSAFPRSGKTPHLSRPMTLSPETAKASWNKIWGKVTSSDQQKRRWPWRSHPPSESGNIRLKVCHLQTKVVFVCFCTSRSREAMRWWKKGSSNAGFWLIFVPFFPTGVRRIAEAYEMIAFRKPGRPWLPLLTHHFFSAHQHFLVDSWRCTSTLKKQ